MEGQYLTSEQLKASMDGTPVPQNSTPQNSETPPATQAGNGTSPTSSENIPQGQGSEPLVNTEVPSGTAIPDGEGQTAQPAPSAPQRPEYLGDLPFNDPTQLVEGYKNLQRQYSEIVENPLIKAARTDPNLVDFINKAFQVYQNPYALQGNVPKAPDPNNYNFLDDRERQQYEQDLQQYVDYKASETARERTMGFEQQLKFEQAKNEFRQKYPSVNFDEVKNFTEQKAKNGGLSYEDIYKIMSYDKVKQIAIEEYKQKEKEKRMALQQQTPGGASIPVASANNSEEVLRFINAHGFSEAEKRYGVAGVNKALEEQTNKHSPFFR